MSEDGKKRKKKPGRASWFKIFLNDRVALQAIGAEAVGEGLLAALTYFSCEPVPELSKMGGIAFTVFRAAADESLKSYKKAVDDGLRGAEERWGRDEE